MGPFLVGKCRLLSVTVTTSGFRSFIQLLKSLVCSSPTQMAFQLRGEKKHQAEVKLCEKADQVVAVGPKLAEAYLRACGKDQDVLNPNPGFSSKWRRGESERFVSPAMH